MQESASHHGRMRRLVTKKFPTNLEHTVHVGAAFQKMNPKVKIQKFFDREVRTYPPSGSAPASKSQYARGPGAQSGADENASRSHAKTGSCSHALMMCLAMGGQVGAPPMRVDPPYGPSKIGSWKRNVLGTFRCSTLDRGSA